MVRVERAEPVAGRGDRLRRAGGRPEHGVQRRARAGSVISSTGNSTPSSVPSARSVAPNPGTVSIRVMSRSKPTTRLPHGLRVGGLPRVRCTPCARLRRWEVCACLTGGTRTEGSRGMATRRVTGVPPCHRPGRRARRRRPTGPGRRRRRRRAPPGHARRPRHRRLPRPPVCPGRTARPWRTPRTTVLAGGRCRAGLPVDHRPERFRRRAHRRPGQPAAIRPPGAAGRGERRTTSRRRPGQWQPDSPRTRSRGGAGVVVGVVDTGIWPESPLFASSGDLGTSPPTLPRRLPSR